MFDRGKDFWGDARVRRVLMKKLLEVLGWLTAVVLFAFATHAVFAAPPAAAQRGRARTTEVADDVTPASIVRAARTVYVTPGEHVDSKYLEYKLQKKAEWREWGLMIVEDERKADLVLKVEKAGLNYVFRLVDPRTSVVAVSGKVVAVNKLLAAEYLGTEVVKKLKQARASGDDWPSKKKKKKGGDDEDDFDETQESES